MKYSAAFKKYVQNLLPALADLFGLQQYEFTVNFVNGDPPQEGWIASVTTQTDYLRALIEIYPGLYATFKEGDKAAVCEALVHELCHVIAQPLAETAYNHVAPAQEDIVRWHFERQTQTFTRIIMNLLPPEVYK